MEILRKMLDNLHAVVLKYFGKMNIVLIGKSIAGEPSESKGHWLKAFTGKNAGKCVRERSVLGPKVINESGTAAHAASCT